MIQEQKGNAMGRTGVRDVRQAEIAELQQKLLGRLRTLTAIEAGMRYHKLESLRLEMTMAERGLDELEAVLQMAVKKLRRASKPNDRPWEKLLNGAPDSNG